MSCQKDHINPVIPVIQRCFLSECQRRLIERLVYETQNLEFLPIYSGIAITPEAQIEKYLHLSTQSNISDPFLGRISQDHVDNLNSLLGSNDTVILAGLIGVGGVSGLVPIVNNRIHTFLPQISPVGSYFVASNNMLLRRFVVDSYVFLEDEISELGDNIIINYVLAEGSGNDDNDNQIFDIVGTLASSTVPFEEDPNDPVKFTLRNNNVNLQLQKDKNYMYVVYFNVEGDFETTYNLGLSVSAGLSFTNTF